MSESRYCDEASSILPQTKTEVKVVRHLEILFAPAEIETYFPKLANHPNQVNIKMGGEQHTRLRIHITFNMQLTSQYLRPTKEHTRLRRTVNLSNTLEHHIPIRTTEIGRCSQSRNGISVRVGIINHDVCRIINLDLGSQVGVDLDVIIHILCFNREEKTAEPFERAKITTDPEEVDFAETGLLLGIVHAVPD